MNTIINEELNKMKYLLGYQRGMVISEQALVQSTTTAPAASVEDVVKQIQTILNTKYGTKLAVDGKWGNLTQTAFESAVKTKSAGTPKTVIPGTPDAPNPTVQKTVIPGTPDAPNPNATPATGTAPVAPATPAAAPTTPAAAPTTPAAAPTTPAAAPTPEDIVGTEVAQPTRRDQRRERQDLRRSNRRAMQDLRTQQRAQ